MKQFFVAFLLKFLMITGSFFHQFPDIYCHFISVSITTKTFYIFKISIVASKIFILIPVVEVVVVVVVVVTDTLSVVTVITTAVNKIIHSSICTIKIIILIIDSVRCQKW